MTKAAILAASVLEHGYVSPDRSAALYFPLIKEDRLDTSKQICDRGWVPSAATSGFHPATIEFGSH